MQSETVNISSDYVASKIEEIEELLATLDRLLEELRLVKKSTEADP